MNPERWERIKELFGEALEHEPSSRQAFLRQACPDDEMYEEVVTLVAAQADGDLLSPSHLTFPGFAPEELAEGTLLKDRYKVGKEIAEGGFAKVFIATDEHLLGRRVVIKVLRERNNSDLWSKARFEDEIRALSMIDHPSVIGVLDAGATEDGLRYLVMQFVEGQTLRSLIGGVPMPYERVAKLVTQVGLAVGAAHKVGIIHQDIKPENVMVQELPDGTDRVRLIDFGIARLRAQATSTVITRVVGSLSYMAPEQLLGRPSAASDIFGLGVMAYELITGAKPFAAQNPIELYSCQQNAQFKRPKELRRDLPDLAEQAIERALAFSPEDRYPSAEEFAVELAAALEQAGGVSHDPRLPRPASPDGKNRFDVFVSYASRDADFADELIDELERRGCYCFDGTRNPPLGEPSDDPQGEAIAQSSCFLVILTGDADRSLRVLQEAKAAAKLGKPVIALSVDSVRPTGILEFALTRPVWVECSSSPSSADYGRVEASIRRFVPLFCGAEKHRVPAKPNEPREPLLTEFGARFLFGFRGNGQLRVIAAGILWAVITCILSILGNAADITVNLAPAGSGAAKQIRFGYLYELNGAFTYLFILPLYLYCALQFVRQAQVALIALASRDQLVARRSAEDGAIKSPLTWVGEANRRWLSPALLLFVLVVSVLLMVGAEYLPPNSDYKNLMFGYVQAPWIADYPVECKGCTLDELGRKTGRKLDALDGVGMDDLKTYRIVEPFYHGRYSGSVQRIAFVLFMISVLGLEVAFGVLVVWTILKILFILQLLYRSISPSNQFPLQLYLRFTDPQGMFGLEPVHRILSRVVALIGMSVVLEVLSWWTNFLKGSKRTLTADLFSLAGWGQFLVTNYSIVLAAMLLLYLFFLSSRTRELAGEECTQLTELGRTPRTKRGTALDDLLRVVGGQSIWASSRFTALYLFAPVLYVFSLIAFDQVGIARQVGVVWDLFLRHVLGRE